MPFPLVDVLMRSGDIRDRSLKLSEIAPNYGQVLPSQILGGGAGRQNVYPNCHACFGALYVKKFGEVTFPRPKVITANTLNFKPIFERLFS